MISIHSGVEVTQENKFFFAGDTADSGCQLVIKPILGVQCGREYRGVHADEGDRACGGFEAESEESFRTVAAWFYCI